MNSVILVAEGVQDQEFWYPYYRLQELGKVLTVAPSRDKLFGKYGIPITPDLSFTEYLFPRTLTKEQITQGYWFPPEETVTPDILIIPGGWSCPEILRMRPDALDIVKWCNAKNVVIGAICHGPQVLISAELCKGRYMTAYVGVKDDLINAGAMWCEGPVVRDSNIITAQHYRDNPKFMKEILSGF